MVPVLQDSHLLWNRKRTCRKEKGKTARQQRNYFTSGASNAAPTPHVHSFCPRARSSLTHTFCPPPCARASRTHSFTLFFCCLFLASPKNWQKWHSLPKSYFFVIRVKDIFIPSLLRNPRGAFCAIVHPKRSYSRKVGRESTKSAKKPLFVPKFEI